MKCKMTIIVLPNSSIISSCVVCGRGCLHTGVLQVGAGRFEASFCGGFGTSTKVGTAFQVKLFLQINQNINKYNEEFYNSTNS